MSSTVPDRDHEAVLSFEYPGEPRARIVAGALAPEVGDLDETRSTAAVSRDGDVVRVRVLADDLVALRAAINGWSRLVATAEGTIRGTDGGSSDPDPPDTDPPDPDPSDPDPPDTVPSDIDPTGTDPSPRS